MKLRIRGNSLRLRLTRTEVAAVAQKGAVVERTGFGGDTVFQYRLAVSDDASACTAALEKNTLEVTLPAGIAVPWATSETVSIEAEQALDNGSSLRILVEKDFACLVDRPGEDDSDAYPHPGEC